LDRDRQRCAGLRWRFGAGHHWGDTTALAGMLLGILVMMKSQEGYVPPELPEYEDGAGG
jgi:hypothetical protein